MFQFAWHNRDIDVTTNHLGKSIWEPTQGPTEKQGWSTQTIAIAPSVLLVCMPDGATLLTSRPTRPTSMRVKRHRPYPQETLARPDLAERHAEQTAAVRTFVGQDGYAFALVQHGLRSCFAPRGPVACRDQVLIGFNRWLIDRDRTTEQADAVAVV